MGIEVDSTDISLEEVPSFTTGTSKAVELFTEFAREWPKSMATNFIKVIQVAYFEKNSHH